MKPETKKTYRSLVERSMPDWLKLPVNALNKEMILGRHQALVKPTDAALIRVSAPEFTLWK